MKKIIQNVKNRFTLSIDDKFYAQSLAELRDRTPDPATFARALADSEGSEEVTRALYIKYRATRLQENVNAEAAELKAKRDEFMKSEIMQAFSARYPGSNQLPEYELFMFCKREHAGEDISQEIKIRIKETLPEWDGTTENTSFWLKLSMVIVFVVLFFIWDLHT